MTRFIRFVPGDRPLPDAGEIVPGADYLGVITGAQTPERRPLVNIKDIVPPKPFQDTKRGWGLIIATVAAVLPYLNGMVAAWTGVQIDAPMVALVGEAVTHMIDAVGVGVGVALYVWGSIFPTAPLTFTKSAQPVAAMSVQQAMMAPMVTPSFADILQALLISLSTGVTAGAGSAGSTSVMGGGLVGVLVSLGLAYAQTRLAKKKK